jgi:hypothetical protein
MYITAGKRQSERRAAPPCLGQFRDGNGTQHRPVYSPRSGPNSKEILTSPSTIRDIGYRFETGD